MNTKNYSVKFFRKAEKEGEKDTFLGSVDLDDVGTNNQFPIQAKAFRQASPGCLMANLVLVYQTS